MLFKNNEGKYIIINRKDFITDKDYYLCILSIKDPTILPKQYDVMDNLLEILQKKKEYITYKPKNTSNNVII